MLTVTSAVVKSMRQNYSLIEKELQMKRSMTVVSLVVPILATSTSLIAGTPAGELIAITIPMKKAGSISAVRLLFTEP